VLLVSQVRGQRRNHRLYHASMAAAEVAFAEEDYEEAERLAKRALGFKPDHEAPQRVLSELRKRKPVSLPMVRSKMPRTVEDPAKRYGQFEPEESTAATRPADLNSLSKRLEPERHSKGKQK